MRVRTLTPLLGFFLAIGIGLWAAFFAALGLRIWLGNSVMYWPLDIGAFLWVICSPFIFWIQDNLQDEFNHLVECHPLLARMVWEPGLGPRPLRSSYRLLCRRRLCRLRLL